MWIVVHSATHDGEARLVNSDHFVQMTPGPEHIELVVIIGNQESCLNVTESLADLAQLLGAVELGGCPTCKGTGKFDEAEYRASRAAEPFARVLFHPLPADGSPCPTCNGTGKAAVPYRERGE